MCARRNVAAWMAERGITFEQLLDRSGLDRRVLEAILQGRWTPSPSQRRRVASALQVAVEQVTWGHTTEVSHLHGHGPQFGRTP